MIPKKKKKRKSEGGEVTAWYCDGRIARFYRKRSTQLGCMHNISLVVCLLNTHIENCVSAFSNHKICDAMKNIESDWKEKEEGAYLHSYAGTLT